MNRLEELTIQLTREVQTKAPSKIVLEGKYVRLEPFDTKKHHESLYQNLLVDPNAFQWLIEPKISSL